MYSEEIRKRNSLPLRLKKIPDRCYIQVNFIQVVEDPFLPVFFCVIKLSTTHERIFNKTPVVP